MLGIEHSHNNTAFLRPHVGAHGTPCVDAPLCYFLRSTATRRGQRGFSLLEVLIAVLLLSFGLLGLARLQLLSLQHNQSAGYSTHATFLAHDVLDRIRANRHHAMDYAIGIDAPPPAGNDIAEQDLRDWKRHLRSLLPGCDSDPACGGSIAVTRHTGGRIFHEIAITLRWTDARWKASSDDQIREFIVRTAL